MSLQILIDHNATNTTFTYSMSSTRQCTTINILDDDKLENTERFYGHLMIATDESLITVKPNKTQVDIYEDLKDGEEFQICVIA